MGEVLVVLSEDEAGEAVVVEGEDDFILQIGIERHALARTLSSPHAALVVGRAGALGSELLDTIIVVVLRGRDAVVVVALEGEVFVILYIR